MITNDKVYDSTTVPNIVKDLVLFFEKNPEARRLTQLVEREPDFFAALMEREDFNLLEDIIDGVADDIEAEKDVPFIERLKTAIAALYPMERPEFCQKVAGAINRTNVLTWENILNDQEPTKKKGEINTNPVLGALFEALPINVKTLLIEAFSRALEDAKTTGKAENTKEFKIALTKAFGNELNTLFPRPDRKLQKTELNTDQAQDQWFIYSALSDLLSGQYENLDPVIGDEACEARPPILLDIREEFLNWAAQKASVLILLAKSYQARHRNDVIGKNRRIAPESSCTIEFINLCDNFCQTIIEFKVKDYISLCKMNTVASTMAADEWGIVSYDRDKGIFTPDVKSQKRSQLSIISVSQIRRLAKFVTASSTTQCGGKTALQVCNVLERVNAAKDDRGNPICSLPIYETMRTVLCYEGLKGRPILLSLYHISVQNEQYTLLDIDTIAYVFNNKTEKFQVVDVSAIDANIPCVTMQGYHLINQNAVINVSDGCNSFAGTLEEYRQGFLSCDMPLQIMIYSAVHPPLAHGSKIDNVELDDAGREYVKGLQQETTGGNKWDKSNQAITRSSQFSLLDPECNLFAEYEKLYQLGIQVDLNNKQYMSRPGGGQVCVRTLDGCAFTIHHINFQTPLWVLSRNRRAKEVGRLNRYHNFDTGQSYDSLEEAQGAKDKKKKK